MQNNEVKLLVTVKPLVWGETSYGRPEAFSIIGVYRVNEAMNGGWSVVFGGLHGRALEGHDGRTNFVTIDAAKARAQTHFDAEIRKTLSAIPSTVSGETKSNYPEIPDGWRMVPVEPTAEMVAAWPFYKHGAGHERAIYAAMLAAAPSPANPAETQAVEVGKRLPVMSATAVEDELSGKLVWDCHEIDGRDGEQMPVVELAAETFAVGTTIQIFEPGRGEVS